MCDFSKQEDAKDKEDRSPGTKPQLQPPEKAPNHRTRGEERPANRTETQRGVDSGDRAVRPLQTDRPSKLLIQQNVLRQQTLRLKRVSAESRRPGRETANEFMG